MTEASIPVDLFNPGQVFACMGFLEAANVLLGQAEGGFDWTNESDVRFKVRADGSLNPIEAVLAFLAKAEVRPYAHRGFDRASKKKKRGEAPTRSVDEGDHDSEEPLASRTPALLETFPAARGELLALPVKLVDFTGDRCRCLSVTHWADGSSRNNFKLYSGNRSAEGIAQAMLQGVYKKGGKKSANSRSNDKLKTLGVAQLWQERRSEMIQNPFQVLTAIGGSFNFDARGAWTAIDAGYSLDEQNQGIEASPVVEILAAIGLEHARPFEYETRKVRYGVWRAFVPPPLARAALGGVYVGVPIRIFRFTLALSGKNKIVTFAEEETSL